MAAPAWEYKIVPLGEPDATDSDEALVELEAQANIFGSEGWELVSIQSNRSGSRLVNGQSVNQFAPIFYFKRQL